MGDFLDKRDLRDKNLELLRSCLRQVRQATKPQLAELTGLSVVTVNSLLQELLLNEEADTTEEAASSGGRPAQSYSFNAKHRLALAVYMHEKAGRDTMFISVEDLLGNILEASEIQPERVNLELFSEVLCPYFRRYPQISVVIVGLPGVEVQDRLAVIDYLELKDTMFCTQLSERLGCPVVFENDINAAVAGYAYRLGKKCQQETIVGIYFPQNYPPGAGIFLQGKLYKGRDGMAGEIGHRFRLLKPQVERKLVDRQTMQDVAQAILLFASTWNPHCVVVYNELVEPGQAEFVRELCMQEVPREFLPEIVLKSGIYEDYGQGIRCLATEYLNNKKEK